MPSSSDSRNDSRRPWQGAHAEPRPPTGDAVIRAAAAAADAAATDDASITTVAAALLDDTDQAICALDGDWRFVYVNPAMLRLTRRNRDELIGSTVWQAFDGTAGSIVESSYRRAVAEQVRVEFELFYGPLQSWFDVCAVPRDGLLVVRFEDVTARVETHAALVRSEARFQLAADASHDVLWDYDFVAGRLWCSDSFIRTFGYPAPLHAATLPAWRDRLHDDDRDGAVTAIAHAVAGGVRRASVEYRMRASDGRWLHVLDRMHFLHDEDGSASRAVGVLVDITAQRAAEERQRFLVNASMLLTSTLDYRQRLRELARLCAGPLCDYCVIDVALEDGGIDRVEAAHADSDRDDVVRKLLRFPPVHDRSGGVPEALRTGAPLLVPDLDDEALRALAQSDEHLSVLRSLSPCAYLVIPLRAKDETLGALSLVMCTADRRFTDDDVQLARDLADQAALDIHDARLYQQVENARRQAEEANHAKDRFLAMISHELRTPLTAIIGFAELIDAGSSGAVTELQRSQVTRIMDSAWHLVGLVDEVMDYARMEAGAEQLRIQPTDVAALVRDVAMLLEPDAAKRSLALRCAAPDTPVVVETDPGKLRRIVMNLLGNALKFTDSGTVEVLLDWHDDGDVAIAVRDTGPGISDADRERIFEAFVQAEDTQTRSHGGTGLGLAITRRYARMLGGDVVVDSEPGSGSTFTFHMGTSPVRSA